MRAKSIPAHINVPGLSQPFGFLGKRDSISTPVILAQSIEFIISWTPLYIIYRADHQGNEPNRDQRAF